jgi:hypothetical protein
MRTLNRLDGVGQCTLIKEADLNGVLSGPVSTKTSVVTKGIYPFP